MMALMCFASAQDTAKQPVITYQEVLFSDLLKNPKDYDKKHIVVKGFYFSHRDEGPVIFQNEDDCKNYASDRGIFLLTRSAKVFHNVKMREPVEVKGLFLMTTSDMAYIYFGRMDQVTSVKGIKKKELGADSNAPKPPSSGDEVGAGPKNEEKPTWTKSVRWMTDSEVEPVDFPKIIRNLRIINPAFPTDKKTFNRLDAVLYLFENIALALPYPSLGFEDGNYYYIFFKNKDTGLVRSENGFAINKKTLKMYFWDLGGFPDVAEPDPYKGMMRINDKQRIRP